MEKNFNEKYILFLYFCVFYIRHLNVALVLEYIVYAWHNSGRNLKSSLHLGISVKDTTSAVYAV